MRSRRAAVPAPTEWQTTADNRRPLPLRLALRPHTTSRGRTSIVVLDVVVLDVVVVIFVDSDCLQDQHQAQSQVKVQQQEQHQQQQEEAQREKRRRR